MVFSKLPNYFSKSRVFGSKADKKNFRQICIGTLIFKINQWKGAMILSMLETEHFSKTTSALVIESVIKL